MANKDNKDDKKLEAPSSLGKLEDDVEYKVKLARPVRLGSTVWRPDQSIVMRGGLLKELSGRPENEGAFSGAEKVG